MYSIDYYKRDRIENPIKVVTQEHLDTLDINEVISRRCANIKTMTIDFKDIDDVSHGKALSDIDYLYEWCKKNKVKKVRLFNDNDYIEEIMFEILLTSNLVDVDKIDSVLKRVEEETAYADELSEKLLHGLYTEEELQDLQLEICGAVYRANYLISEYNEYNRRKQNPPKTRVRNFRRDDLKNMKCPEYTEWV